MPEAHDIFKRFSSVFEQTYTRFLDLQKAEAQAREAQIEAALERVRSRTMAMQNSDELAETSVVVFKQLMDLGIEPNRLYIGIIKDHSGDIEFWATDEDGTKVSAKFTGNKNNNESIRKMYHGWAAQEKSLTIDMQGKELEDYFHYLGDVMHVPLREGLSQKRRVQTMSFFSKGFICIASPDKQSEQTKKLLERFAAVFNLTYTRFNDLQIAEASTREAIKQAALDRIRADIASMRTISDLDRITPLIWNELTILGIPFIRCGVFIMDDSQQLIHTFLSTPDGKAIAAFHLPYDTPGNIQLVVSNWKDKKNYLDHWDENEFKQFAEILVQQGALDSAENYLKTIPQGGFYLHFLPFLQGMLYVGNTTQLSEDEIKLIQSVADAFSTAYARYEDFNRLEAAKQQVDKTLVDLKQAQQQLVQSEKMASLGELTAGIAHEIQNPLNFVNNFSEVSNELLEEMNTELDKGYIAEAKAIADDVKQNLEKILHHGKRADSIVKGMLQHSRRSSSVKELTDINTLTDEYLRLCYHGLRTKDKSFNAAMNTDFDTTIPGINIVPQDIG
ncbi:MAG: sensor histidine kinase, partial [Ginsengibacter sp.]